MSAPIDPDRALALTHVPEPNRAAVAALWALDVRLGGVVASTTEPLIGQMRLTWWFERLSALEPSKRHDEPLLDDLAVATVGKGGVDGAMLAAMIEGWEVLLDPLPFGEDVLMAHANERGARLFALSAALMGGESDHAAGCGWALADFATRCTDAGTSERAFGLARKLFGSIQIGKLPRPLRILARFAAADAMAGRRVSRSLWRTLKAIR